MLLASFSNVVVWVVWVGAAFACIGSGIAVVSVFIWMKATLPRLRYDQLMRFGWKVLLPVATLNALVTALLVVWI